jgi:hypothetical protein
MAAAGAGDLVARHVKGTDLPDYVGAFLLSRYQDAGYVSSLASPTAGSGQL